MKAMLEGLGIAKKPPLDGKGDSYDSASPEVEPAMQQCGTATDRATNLSPRLHRPQGFLESAPMEVTRLIAVRHGETAWNVDTRIQGHLDIPLNNVGVWQAKRAGQALADEPIDAIYASDLQRAWQTARAIAEAQTTPLEVIADVRLRERAFGNFEGRTFAEIKAESPEEALRWRAREPAFAPGGGESLIDFRQRITTCAAELAARHVGGLIALVAHGGVMDVLYRAATGQELQTPRTWPLTNAAINRLLWTEEGFSLVGWGDSAHLDCTRGRPSELSTCTQKPFQIMAHPTDESRDGRLT